MHPRAPHPGVAVFFTDSVGVTMPRGPGRVVPPDGRRAKACPKLCTAGGTKCRPCDCPFEDSGYGMYPLPMQAAARSGLRRPTSAGREASDLQRHREQRVRRQRHGGAVPSVGRVQLHVSVASKAVQAKITAGPLTQQPVRDDSSVATLRIAGGNRIDASHDALSMHATRGIAATAGFRSIPARCRRQRRPRQV